MPTVTAPYVDTQQVVTGFMYQLHIAADAEKPGITRLEIGPYFFPGALPRIKYPEAVTNELCPPGWQSIGWYTDPNGASWLRWQGGVLLPEDGEQIFQLTSNYPSSNTGAALHVWRQNARYSEKYAIEAPDYSQQPPLINPRHDVIGKGTTFTNGVGCAPLLLFGIFGATGLLAIALHHLLS